MDLGAHCHCHYNYILVRKGNSTKITSLTLFERLLIWEKLTRCWWEGDASKSLCDIMWPSKWWVFMTGAIFLKWMAPSPVDPCAIFGQLHLAIGPWQSPIYPGCFTIFFSSKPPFSGKGAYVGPQLGVAKPGTAEASSERAGSIMERGERCPADLPFVQSPALRSFPWVG